MAAHVWPPAEPPLEAYSRVTDPGRFAPLHQLAGELLERLGAEFDVIRTEAFGLPSGVQSFEHARPPVQLTPSAPTAAPIAVAFTTFPSLLVRCGRWLVESFPACGCDACAETAAGEGERLRATIAHVIAGHFRERIAIPLLGHAMLEWELGVPDAAVGCWGSSVRVPRAHARTLIGTGPATVQWKPWPRRTG